MTEPELMQRVAAGDAEAQAEFVRTHRGPVYRLAVAICREPAAAEDAMQEVFIAAIRGAHRYRGDASLRSWMLTITRHTCYRGARKRAGEPERFEPLDALGVDAGWGSPADPEALLIRLRDRQHVQRALASLAPADQEILTLRELEGLSGAETAQRLDLGLAAMKSRLHRARLRLVAAIRKGSTDGA